MVAGDVGAAAVGAGKGDSGEDVLEVGDGVPVACGVGVAAGLQLEDGAVDLVLEADGDPSHFIRVVIAASGGGKGAGGCRYRGAAGRGRAFACGDFPKVDRNWQTLAVHPGGPRICPRLRKTGSGPASRLSGR